MTPEHIRKTAIKMAAENGLENITRNGLCQRAGIPAGSFAHVTGQTFKAFIRSLAGEGHAGAGEVTRRRMDPELRSAHIVATALRLAESGHIKTLTRADVANAAGVSTGTVTKYFSTMPQLRRAVMRLAKKENNKIVTAQS